MRTGKLFASILAGIAAMAGSSYQVEPTTITLTPAEYAKIQRGDQMTGFSRGDNTRTPATAPTGNAETQIIRAGSFDLHLPRRYRNTPRWAWVGRKVNGRFGYYCKRAGVRNG